LLFSSASAFDIFQPGDAIVAIDRDITTGSDFPGGEAPANILDGNTATKYLNFGETNTGFVVTPAFGSSILQSFSIATANDSPERDPFSYIIQGTNDNVSGLAENINGNAFNWTDIAVGDFTELAVDPGRFFTISPISFANSTAYTSYRMIFPTVRDAAAANSMQVADVNFFTGMGGTGSSILAPGDFIRAVRIGDFVTTSNYPAGEAPANVLDRNSGTKYLNFGEERSGFIVTPEFGGSVATAFEIVTANDAIERDPASYEIWGTNELPISTPDNGAGDEQMWTLIQSGTLDLPTDRFASSGQIPISNSEVYGAYRIVFPTVRDAATANSMQIADFRLIGEDQITLEVNRNTGEVLLRAVQDVSIASYSISSALETIDFAEWTSIAGTSADPDDTWAESSRTSGLLAESDQAGGADNGFTLLAGQTRSLGNIYTALPTAFEDFNPIAFSTDGLQIGFGVEYIGTEIALFGDYDGNGVVDLADWNVFRLGYGGNFTGMTAAQAYLMGDMDGDFDSDITDFNIFVDNAGGLAALFGGASVPEPGTFVLLGGMAVAGLVVARRRRARGAAAVVAIAIAALWSSAASAQHLANRAFTSLGVPVGITTPADQPNETAASGPANLFDVIQLEDTVPVVGFDINDDLHRLNFQTAMFEPPVLQYAALGGEPKFVFFDYGSPVTASWFGMAHRLGGDPLADRVGQVDFWFSNTPFGTGNDERPTADPDTSFSLVPTDNRLLDNIFRPYTLGGDFTGQYVAVRFNLSEVSANQPTNNLGAHEFRLMDGPTDLLLTVNRSTGEVTLANNLPGAVAIDLQSYAIESPIGALDESAFNGLNDNGAPFSTWQIGGGSNAQRLVEGNFANFSTLAAGSGPISLGNIFNPLLLTEDIRFIWTDSANHPYDARVV
jgi:hypothetical protein